MSELRDRRIKLGLTLRDVEEITGGQVSNPYLSQLENGRIKMPSLRIVCALAACYHVSVEEIAEWLGSPKVSPPLLCPTCGRVMTNPIQEIS